MGKYEIRVVLCIVLSQSCIFGLTAINGGWTEWSAFRGCSETCGRNARQTRFRTCTLPPPTNGGRHCTGIYLDVRSCNLSACFVDGAWSPWTNTTPCSATCGLGVKVRNRTCDQPPPLNGGKVCAGNSSETVNCTLPGCPVDGGWTIWGNFSACSATCGNALKVRNRSCTQPSPQFGGKVCAGNSSEAAGCSLANCSIDGAWSPWTNPASCSATCGLGVKVRNRTCDQPPPLNGGKVCAGNSSETVNCTLPGCPVDGSWSEWGNFSSCDVTCGGGVKVRSRSCDQPPPRNGGKVCAGNSTESAGCALKDCPTTKNCTYDNGGCDHMCESHLNGSSTCSCEEGYRLQQDQATCKDVNECEWKNACVGMCINYEGSYMCLCSDPNTYWDVDRLVCEVNRD